MSDRVVYDKAKWHAESCVLDKLRDDQGFVQTGLFVVWLAINDLILDDSDTEFPDDEVVRKTKERSCRPTALYEWYDGVLIDDMLTDQGNRFAKHYFDFESGSYMIDYENYLLDKGQSCFSVPNTWESYDRIAPVIDARYRQFQGEDVPLPPMQTVKPKRSLLGKLFGKG